MLIALKPTSPWFGRLRVLLNQGQWTHAADTRDLAATTPHLLPFVLHETKCTQLWHKDPRAWRRANDANLAAPWALVGYFLDPVLFEMLANSCLQLPAEPFHVPRWRQASLLSFTLSVHHVMRVGRLESPMVWRSLLYPSPARLPLAWGVTQLPLPIPHDLPSADMVASAKWLVRALLTLHPGDAHPTLPEWSGLGEALPTGSHSPCWLHFCPNETPELLADWLAEHSVS